VALDVFRSVGDFVKVAGLPGMSEECLNWVPKGMEVPVSKEVSDVLREL
jgi:hypothetical protein